MNVADTINTNFCIGCGICTAICPNQHIMLINNNFNQLQIKEICNTACNEKCKMCLSVCPFSDYTDNEDIISKNYLMEDISNIKKNADTILIVMQDIILTKGQG